VYSIIFQVLFSLCFVFDVAFLLIGFVTLIYNKLICSVVHMKINIVHEQQNLEKIALQRMNVLNLICLKK